MIRLKSHLRHVLRLMFWPIGKLLLSQVNPDLARRDSQMLHAIQDLVRAEMDTQSARSESVSLLIHQIIHLLNDVREFQRGSHSDLMHVPVEKIQATLDSLVSKNQATMEEVQLTLDSLIREVVRVESRFARTKASIEHSELIVPRRRQVNRTDSSKLRVHSDDQFIRPEDFESTGLFQRTG